MTKDSKPALSIAHTVTINVMTDGTIRIIEFYPYGGGDLDNIVPVWCWDDEDALMFLRDTSALSTNPDWYAG